MRQVKVRAFPLNYFYAVAAVATAGFLSPMRVAWQCLQPVDGSPAAKGENNVSR
jgi:hypothetical protein